MGRTLVRACTEEGYEVTVLTRAIRQGHPLPQGASWYEGNPTSPGSWQREASGHEAIINLAGASIFGRWTSGVKKAIRDSRILTTNRIVEGIARGEGAGAHLLSASAVGYYGSWEGKGQEEALGEEAPPGDDFLASVCREWETSALAAQRLGAKVTLCRFGLVLGAGGGLLERLVPLFRRHLGSPLGSGNQWTSWIHEKDLARIFLFLLTQGREVTGPVNCTAPHPVRNREMTEALGEVLGVSSWLPSVPAFMIRGVMGEFGQVILGGQRVVPRKLEGHGFRFQFPTLREALRDLLGGGAKPL